MSAANRPLYIAVEGPIGVGKTTLVHRLAERLGARVLLEPFAENPFLPKFYEDPEHYAFQTQLFFLMSRFKQQEELLQPDLFRPSLVADYHLLKDRLFAELTLADDELRLYESLFQTLAARILKPDAIIYLTAPIDVLLRRIAARGRDYEQDMDVDYLRDLARIYQRFFARYSDTPVVRIDNSELDYATPGPDAERVLDDILAQVRAVSG